MKNPIKELRESTGLSIKAFSTLYRCPYATLSKAESGHISRVPASVLVALERAGFNTDGFQIKFYRYSLESVFEESKK